MRILVDSNALIELFRGSAKGRKVRDLMGANEVVLSPICTFEVLSVIGRVHSKKKAEEFQP